MVLPCGNGFCQCHPVPGGGGGVCARAGTLISATAATRQANQNRIRMKPLLSALQRYARRKCDTTGANL